MISNRGLGWMVGLTLAFALGWAIQWHEDWREFGPLLVVLFAATLGLGLEIWQLVRGKRPLPEADPADGEVEIVPIRGVRGQINPSDPKFQRFMEVEPDEARLRSRPQSTPPLRGRIAVLSIFIGSDGQAWSDEEIVRTHSSLIRAGVWIEREAVRWNAPVNLVLAQTYFVADAGSGYGVDSKSQEIEIGFVSRGESLDLQELDALPRVFRVAGQGAETLGYHDVVELIEAISPRVDADTRVWVLHLRRAGRSWAVPRDVIESMGVKLAVCYARTTNFTEPLQRRTPFSDPVTIAHELLHLFGATDKYGSSLRSFPKGSVTSREIMRLDEQSLFRLRVDPLTAREIGWFEG